MSQKILLTLLVPQSDKDILQAIADQEGNASMSAIVRRMIREEAQRRGLSDGITVPVVMDGSQIGLSA